MTVSHRVDFGVALFGVLLFSVFIIFGVWGSVSGFKEGRRLRKVGHGRLLVESSSERLNGTANLAVMTDSVTGVRCYRLFGKLTAISCLPIPGGPMEVK